MRCTLYADDDEQSAFSERLEADVVVEVASVEDDAVVVVDDDVVGEALNFRLMLLTLIADADHIVDKKDVVIFSRQYRTTNRYRLSRCD